MPPKSKEDKKVTKTEPKKSNDDQIRAADQRLKTDSKPSEADFKIILSAADGTTDDRILVSQLIHEHAGKFPSLRKQACSTMIKLTTDDEFRVRYYAIRHVIDFKEDDKNGVYNALYCALGDQDPKIQSQVSQICTSLYTSDEEFRDSFLSALKGLNQNPEAQTEMIKIIKSNPGNTFEDKEELLNEVTQVALKLDPIVALQFAGSQSKNLSEEQKASIGERIIENLRSDFKKKEFDAVCNENLIDLLETTRSLDNTFPTLLLGVISEEVAPKFSQLLAAKDKAVLKRILERTYELNRYVPDDGILVNLYEQIFSTIPKNTQEGNLEFTIIERTLFAMAALARRFTRTFSQLVGKPIVCTGQPGETEGIQIDDKKYDDYTTRLEFIRDSAKEFGHQLKQQQEIVRSDMTLAADDRIEKLRKISKGRTSVANAKKIAFLLLGKKPMLTALPESPSWKNRKPKIGRNQSRNNQGSKQKRFNNSRRSNTNNNNRRSSYNNNRSSRNNNRPRDYGRRK